MNVLSDSGRYKYRFCFILSYQLLMQKRVDAVFVYNPSSYEYDGD